MTLTYEELRLPNYRNSSTAVSLKGKIGRKEKLIELSTDEAIVVPVIAGLNALIISDTGWGKTQGIKDISRGIFGGGIEEGGRANWITARKDTSADELFLEWDKIAEKYVVLEDRINALLNVIDEINRTVELVQNDFFDFMQGSRSIAGCDRQLGREGYSLVLSGLNLNRVNGDFKGTSDIDRALLSRAPIAFDMDYFNLTDKDKSRIASKGDPKIKLAPLRDISDKILHAFHEISRKSGAPDPYMDTYLMFFISGMDYCAGDKQQRKRRAWPMHCAQCSRADEGICSKMKQWEPRTAQAVKRFAHGLNYFVSLKEGGIELDPLDLIFEAAKFTAYHGNLNMGELLSAYRGEDQDMMNEVLAAARQGVEEIRPYLDASIDSAKQGRIITEYIEYGAGAGRKLVSGSAEELNRFENALREKNAAYKRIDISRFEPTEKIGIRTSWIRPQLEVIAEEYAGK